MIGCFDLLQTEDVFEVFISGSEEVIAYFSMTHRCSLLFASLWHLEQSGLCSDIE